MWQPCRGVDSNKRRFRIRRWRGYPPGVVAAVSLEAHEERGEGGHRMVRRSSWTASHGPSSPLPSVGFQPWGWVRHGSNVPIAVHR